MGQQTISKVCEEFMDASLDALIKYVKMAVELKESGMKWSDIQPLLITQMRVSRETSILEKTVSEISGGLKIEILSLGYNRGNEFTQGSTERVEMTFSNNGQAIILRDDMELNREILNKLIEMRKVANG